MRPTVHPINVSLEQLYTGITKKLKVFLFVNHYDIFSDHQNGEMSRMRRKGWIQRYYLQWM